MFFFSCPSYGCEIWSFTVREEQRLRVQRKVFGPKRDEVTGGRKKLHDDFHDLCSSPNIIWVIKSRKMGCADMWHVWERREMNTRFG